MIITNIDELRKPSEPVKDEAKAKEIIGKLEETLRYNGNGIGLAAPQIGIHKQVAIIRYNNFSLDVVNPTNVRLLDGAFLFKDESCLSLPGVSKNTLRARSIDFINNEKESHFYSIEKLESIIVVCVQHEIDHLFGKLFVDYALKPIEGETKIGRNDPCMCGSEKKFKKCCGRGT
jgi:peptide deformylase